MRNKETIEGDTGSYPVLHPQRVMRSHLLEAGGGVGHIQRST